MAVVCVQIRLFGRHAQEYVTVVNSCVCEPRPRGTLAAVGSCFCTPHPHSTLVFCHFMS